MRRTNVLRLMPDKEVAFAGEIEARSHDAQFPDPPRCRGIMIPPLTRGTGDTNDLLGNIK